MHDAIEWVKKHPLALVLIGGVALLALVLFSSSGSSASASTAATGPDDAQVAAAYQAQAAGQQVAAQQEVTDNQTAASVAIAQISANAQNYQVQQQGTVDLANTQASEDVNLAGIQAQVQLADIQNQTNLAQIKSQTDQAGLAAATQEYLSMEQAATTEAAFQTESDIATINANQNIQVAQYNFLGSAVADVSKNKYATLNLTTPNGQSISLNSGKPTGVASSTGSTLAGIGSVIGAIASIF